MSQSKYFKEKLIEEFEYCIKNMKESQIPEESIFFFSAIPAIISRIFNFEYNQQLLFLHFILVNALNQIKSTISLRRGENPIIDIKLIHELSDLLHELMIAFKENKELYEILEKIVVLVYSTTGNGFYLKEKGILK